MVTDNQVRILMKQINQSKTFKTAAAKAGMSEKPPASIADWANYPVNVSLSTTGKPMKMFSKMTGPGYRIFWRLIWLSRLKPYLKLCSESTPANIRMANSGLFSDV
jgi:hypothetical protein